MTKNNSIRKSMTIKLSVVIAITTIGAIIGLLLYFTNSINLFGNIISPGKLGENIYFADYNNLKSINVKTKEVKTIEEAISSRLHVYRIGTQYPLNSKDFQKVAYIKDNSIRIYDGTKSQKIDQPNIESKTSSKLFLSTWSPKADYLIYYISDGFYAEKPELITPELVADDSTVGYYLYSVSKSKSTKLDSIKSSIYGWVPGTNKIAYIQENTEAVDNSSIDTKDIFYYDVTNDKISPQLNESSTGGLMRFSDDGSRILHSEIQQDESAYVISNNDLSNGKEVVKFNSNNKPDITPDFLKGSYNYIAYTRLEPVSCDQQRVPYSLINGGSGCFVKYLETNKNDKKSQELIKFFGFYDFDQAVVLNGLDLSTSQSNEKTLSIYNIESGETEKLYSSSYKIYDKPLLAIGDGLRL